MGYTFQKTTQWGRETEENNFWGYECYRPAPQYEYPRVNECGTTSTTHNSFKDFSASAGMSDKSVTSEDLLEEKIVMMNEVEDNGKVIPC